MTKPIVVLGAGVIGLTCALELTHKGYKVKIVARDLPEDSYSQGFASPWAGANWCPFVTDPRICGWETETFKVWTELLKSGPPGLILELKNTRRFEDKESGFLNHWYQNVVPDYKRLPASECPPNRLGVTFSTLSVNAPKYILWLKAQLIGMGVTFERRNVGSLEEVFGLYGGVDVVINATGLGAKSIIGIQDLKATPVRGQTVLIKSDVVNCTMDTTDDDPPSYIIPRPGGEVICGGCFEEGSYDPQVNYPLARGILERCLKLDPRISKDGTVEGIEVLRHNVAFRPAREGGPRLERESIRVSGKIELKPHLLNKGVSKEEGRKVDVIHAYGVGSAGYQTSWGVAKNVRELLDSILSEQKARL